MLCFFGRTIGVYASKKSVNTNTIGDTILMQVEVGCCMIGKGFSKAGKRWWR